MKARFFGPRVAGFVELSCYLDPGVSGALRLVILQESWLPVPKV
jgi:hypothetical protein